jgi:hypothetical protein
VADAPLTPVVAGVIATGQHTSENKGTPGTSTHAEGSNVDDLAVAVGFEPTEAFTSHAFEACSFGRSDTPPPESLPQRLIAAGVNGG